MLFEWDDRKNRRNLRVHGIDFETAVRIFNDPDRIEFYDRDHSADEDRFITIGRIETTDNLICMVYTERKQMIRVISARFADKRERKIYHDCSQGY
ncbi:MAG: BrnT family toxin [Erysipelotrichaceae bacterium]|nr:BrnT family toxin [Erysipelotrichaceae bacterium]